MRKRLLLAFVLLVVLAQVAYGIPRVIMVSNLVRDAQREQLERTADAIAASIERAESVDEADLAALVAPDEHLRFVPAGGSPIEAGSPEAEGSIETTRATSKGEVVLSESRADVNDEVRAAIAPMLVLGALVVLIAALVAIVLSRRLSRPFAQLAEAAEDVGRGRVDLQLPTYRVEEADRIADALQRSATQVGEMLQEERALAAHLSHELRTPLTALGLVLDDAQHLPDLSEMAREDLALAVAQSERLTQTITRILEEARAHQTSRLGRTDVSQLVRDAQDRWSSRVAPLQRRVSVEAAGAVLVAAPSGVVTEVLDALVDNAVVHGAGEVRVSVTATDGHARIRVADEGQGLPETVAGGLLESRRVSDTRSTGLAIAGRAARSVGGRIVAVPGRAAAVDVVLPAVR